MQYFKNKLIALVLVAVVGWTTDLGTRSAEAARDTRFGKGSKGHSGKTYKTRKSSYGKRPSKSHRPYSHGKGHGSTHHRPYGPGKGHRPYGPGKGHRPHRPYGPGKGHGLTHHRPHGPSYKISTSKYRPWAHGWRKRAVYRLGKSYCSRQYLGRLGSGWHTYPGFRFKHRCQLLVRSGKVAGMRFFTGSGKLCRVRCWREGGLVCFGGWNAETGECSCVRWPADYCSQNDACEPQPPPDEEGGCCCKSVCTCTGCTCSRGESESNDDDQ
jgi:hypothetical protein